MQRRCSAGEAAWRWRPLTWAIHIFSPPLLTGSLSPKSVRSGFVHLEYTRFHAPLFSSTLMWPSKGSRRVAQGGSDQDSGRARASAEKCVRGTTRRSAEHNMPPRPPKLTIGYRHQLRVHARRGLEGFRWENTRLRDRGSMKGPLVIPVRYATPPVCLPASHKYMFPEYPPPPREVSIY